MQTSHSQTEAVKGLAREAGFARVGIAPAGPVERPQRLRAWLKQGYHADMAYMARNLSKRLRPDLLVPGARSVICLAASYEPAAPVGGGPVARYARGRDYHKVLRRRCRALMQRIRQIEPAFAGRAFVDSGPVMERSLAAAAGLGWIGRNGCLVVPELGSYVVLCEIICNLALRPDAPLGPQCRDCGACVKACPTGAFVEEGLVDARRCVSYLTIEHRGAIDPGLWPLMGSRLFGCDACQEACPHNRGAPPGEAELPARAAPGLGGAGLADILAWEPKDWDAATRGSATRRATYEMFIRNAIVAAGNSGDVSLCEPLRRLRRPDQRAQVQWAIGRLTRKCRR